MSEVKTDVKEACHWPSCLHLGDSQISGKGVFATRDLDAGVSLCQYVGPVISPEEKEKLPQYIKDRLLRCANGQLIDGSVENNIAQYFNHCCSPNCYMSDENWLITDRPIKCGEELTWFYSNGYFGGSRGPCKCGAPNCKWRNVVVEKKSTPTSKPNPKFGSLVRLWKRLEKD